MRMTDGLCAFGIAAVLAGIVPSAHANSAFCAALQKLTRDVPNEFVNVRAKSIGNGFFRVETELPGKPKCTTFAAQGVRGSGLLMCSWPQQPDAAAQLQRLKANVLACSPGANSREEPNGASALPLHLVADREALYKLESAKPIFGDDPAELKLTIASSRWHSLRPK